MRKTYNGSANLGGVYQIVNETTGKRYLGSAKQFKERANRHASALRAQKHHNKHLQASFNKYDESVFLFEVIEVVLGDKLARTKREEEILQAILLSGEWDMCYNFTKRPLAKQGVWSSTPDETRKKASKASKRLWQKAKHRKHMTQAIKKVWEDPTYRLATVAKMREVTNTPEMREKRRQTTKQLWQEHDYRNRTTTAIVKANKARWADPKQRKVTIEKISKVKTEQWSNPAFREKMIKSLPKKKVAQLIRGTQTIVAIQTSIMAAGRALGINFRNISAVCKGRRKNAGGYTWKFI